MKVRTLTAKSGTMPARLLQVSPPPSKLFVLGDTLESLLKKPCLAVVGSRAVSPYGRLVTTELVEAAARAGVTIISGLALGVDGLAHYAALNAHGGTIAVLPSHVTEVYPASHRQLAQQILQNGGVLVSEYPPGTNARRENFIERNRLVSGLADAVLITEAAEKSGTLHTARFALEQGRDVLVVPGNINSPNSKGTNTLLKAGAEPITCPEDILGHFNIHETTEQMELIGNNAEEQVILDLLRQGVTDASELHALSKLATHTFNQTLTMLEISGRIKPSAGNWYLL